MVPGGFDVDFRDGGASGDAHARDQLTDAESRRVGDSDSVLALIAAQGFGIRIDDTRLRGARRDDITERVAQAAEDDVTLVEDEAAREGVTRAREGRGVARELGGTGSVGVIEDESDRAGAVVDDVGADRQLAAGGGRRRVAQLVDVEVAADVRGARGEPAVADRVVGTVTVLADQHAAGGQGEAEAGEVDGAGGGAVLEETQGVDRAVSGEDDALVLEVGVVGGEGGREAG